MLTYVQSGKAQNHTHTQRSFKMFDYIVNTIKQRSKARNISMAESYLRRA